MQNDINIDFADYQTILLYKGKIDGLVSNCKVEDFMSSLSEDLKVSLKKAKGVVVEFEHHNDLSVSIISCAEINHKNNRFRVTTRTAGFF